MHRRWTAVAEFFTNNAGLKALAMVLAALTFYAIRDVTGFEIRFDVPLEVAVEPGVAILEKDTRSVEVTFRGSADDLRNLEQKQIKALIRPKAAALSGSENVPVSPRDIRGASGVTVVKIKPSTVTLTFDREARKVVQVVRPTTTGTPLIGHAELEYDPRVVTLRGPKQRLQGLEAVLTEPVDVDGRVESFTRTVRVLPPSDKWVSEIEPNEIVARVRIVTELVSHTWTDVRIMTAAKPGSGLSVRFVPPAVNVTLTGRPEVIDGLQSNTVSALVHLDEADRLTTNLFPVRVYLPPRSEVEVSIEPETVMAVWKETD